MRIRLAIALIPALPALLAAQAPMRMENLKLSGAATLARLDMGDLKGQPSRLAWSPDSSELYLQTLEGAFGQSNARLRHYAFRANNGSRKNLQAEPAWAAEYWVAKSGQASPDDARLKIELKTEARQERTTSMPMGGDLARGGVDAGQTGTSPGDAGAAAFAGQRATVHMMLLKGATIGEFVNSVIVPGLTFGWGPQGSKAIVFATPKDGRVVIMDEQGLTLEVGASKDAVLPAWSPDGKRLVWLQRDGRRNFILQVAGVSTS